MRCEIRFFLIFSIVFASLVAPRAFASPDGAPAKEGIRFLGVVSYAETNAKVLRFEFFHCRSPRNANPEENPKHTTVEVRVKSDLPAGPLVLTGSDNCVSFSREFPLLKNRIFEPKDLDVEFTYRDFREAYSVHYLVDPNSVDRLGMPSNPGAPSFSDGGYVWREIRRSGIVSFFDGASANVFKSEPPQTKRNRKTPYFYPVEEEKDFVRLNLRRGDELFWVRVPLNENDSESACGAVVRSGLLKYANITPYNFSRNRTAIPPMHLRVRWIDYSTWRCSRPVPFDREIQIESLTGDYGKLESTGEMQFGRSN